jgi:CPA2 family monovalent cation:H+ antiporter-2
MLATHALALVGVPMKRVIRMVQAQRLQRYELLREEDFTEDYDDVNANPILKTAIKSGSHKEA